MAKRTPERSSSAWFGFREYPAMSSMEGKQHRWEIVAKVMQIKPTDSPKRCASSKRLSDLLKARPEVGVGCTEDNA